MRKKAVKWGFGEAPILDNDVRNVSEAGKDVMKGV